MPAFASAFGGIAEVGQRPATASLTRMTHLCHSTINFSALHGSLSRATMW
jgi:hypothetical protein